MSHNVDVVRQSITIIAKVLSGKGIKVTQSGTNAYVESEDGIPKRINIPYIPDNAADELILAINGFLDHEVAHVLFTDFTISKKEHFLNKSIFQIYNAIEDCRIEKCMRAKFAGSRTNLDGVSNFFIEKYIVPEFAKASNELEMTSTLFTPAVRAWSGQEIFQVFMRDKWGNIKQLQEKIATAIPKIALVESTQDAIDLAHEIGKLLNKDKSPKTDKKSPKTEEKKEEVEEKREEAKSKEDEAPKSDEKGKEDSDKPESDKPEAEKPESDELALDDELDEEPEKEDSKDDDDSDGDDKSEEPAASDEKPESDEPAIESDEGGSDEEPIDSSVGMTVDLESIIESASSDISESISDMISGTIKDSLRGADYKVFSTDYDKVERLDISDCDFTKVKKVVSRIEESARQITGPLQKTLERLVKSKSLVRNLPGKRSGRINASSLYRLKTGDDRVFRQRDMGISNDVAVSLVVDCSGSMSGNKIRIAMESAFALCDVLTRLEITNEVIGFTTLEEDGGMHRDCEKSPDKMRIWEYSRSEALHLPIFKGFDERFGIQQKQRMAVGSKINGLSGLRLRNNVDGESIRIAAKRLVGMTKEKTKQMIVLSDGSPCAAGDSGAIHRDLITSIKGIEAMGIKIIGIGINDDSVKRYYKNNLVINNVNDLPNLIIKELRSMLV